MRRASTGRIGLLRRDRDDLDPQTRQVSIEQADTIDLTHAAEIDLGRLDIRSGRHPAALGAQQHHVEQVEFRFSQRDRQQGRGIDDHPIG
jgi:hypothetical protein